jgi:hypothetical protein
MTQQRKILIAVAGVAALLVGIDRVLLNTSVSGPQPASAAGPPAPLAPPPPASAIPDTPASIGTTATTTHAPGMPSLADRLERAASKLDPQTPDAFGVSGYWTRPQAPPPPVADDAPTFDARRFVRQHPLHAITRDGERAAAMVGGRLMRVGETRDGVTLDRIGEREVEWVGHGVRFRVGLNPR